MKDVNEGSILKDMADFPVLSGKKFSRKTTFDSLGLTGDEVAELAVFTADHYEVALLDSEIIGLKTIGDLTELIMDKYTA